MIVESKTNNLFADFSLAEKFISAGGVLGMFAVGRFFKNNDDIRKRVVHLEKEVAVIRSVQKKGAEDMKEMKTYLHKFYHDIIDRVNEKEIKDQIVDNLDEKLDTILAKINKDDKKQT